MLSLSELPLSEGDPGSQFNFPGWLKERDALLATVESLKGLITQMQTHRETQVQGKSFRPFSLTQTPTLKHVCHVKLLLSVSCLRVFRRPSAGFRQRELAQGASGSSAAGLPERTNRAKARSVQPAGPAGHQRRHHPPESAGAQTGRTGPLEFTARMLFCRIKVHHHLNRFFIILKQDAHHREAMGSLHTAERSSLIAEVRQLHRQLKQLQSKHFTI